MDIEHGCPFCGSDCLKLVMNDYVCHVKCETCLCIGPFARDEESAIERWDQREGMDE
jgi:hypothetical protein